MCKDHTLVHAKLDIWAMGKHVLVSYFSCQFASLKRDTVCNFPGEIFQCDPLSELAGNPVILKNHFINAMSLASPREAVKRLSFSCILL